MEEVEVDVVSGRGNNHSVGETGTDAAETDVSLNMVKEIPNQRNKFARLPLARIKAMMKKNPECGLLSQDAVFLVTKATEMFIEYMARETEKQLTVIGKRKTIMKRDVDSVVQSIPHLCFLDGALE